jgi:hypothetical protein
MTCFWDSIIASLNYEDAKILGINPMHKNKTIFIQRLKEKNKLVDVLWQGKPLRMQEKKEHFEAVKNYNINGIKNGHLTSICDSFLLLICDLLNVNIEHKYLHNIITYKTKNKCRKILKFKSNKGHFSR